MTFAVIGGFFDHSNWLFRHWLVCSLRSRSFHCCGSVNVSYFIYHQGYIIIFIFHLFLHLLNSIILFFVWDVFFSFFRFIILGKLLIYLKSTQLVGQFWSMMYRLIYLVYSNLNSCSGFIYLFIVYFSCIQGLGFGLTWKNLKFYIEPNKLYTFFPI